MKISVVVPTFRRTESLARCLEGLYAQTRQPEEIIVVARDIDEETRRYLDGHPHPLLVRAEIDVTGHVAALNRGIGRSSGDIVAITDDDAVPFPDWLERIEAHFAQDPAVGGIGGRDWVYHGGQLEDGSRHRVGTITAYGRLLGNHHLGTGSAREVRYLKGANMSYRRKAIEGLRLDERLRGSGAQVHNDMDFSMAVRRKGWKLVYDPGVAVRHYPAPRFDEDKRNTFNPTALRNASHNETYVLLKSLERTDRLRCMLWALAVGSKPSPGLVQFLRLLPKERGSALAKLTSSFRGRLEGWRTWRTHSEENRQGAMLLTGPDNR